MIQYWIPILLIPLIGVCWLVVLSSQARVIEVNSADFTLTNLLSGMHRIAWSDVKDPALKFSNLKVSAFPPRIEVSLRDVRFFSLRRSFSVQIKNDNAFAAFEKELGRHVRVIDVTNLADLFRRQS